MTREDDREEIRLDEAERRRLKRSNDDCGFSPGDEDEDPEPIVHNGDFCECEFARASVRYVQGVAPQAGGQPAGKTATVQGVRRARYTQEESSFSGKSGS